MGNRSTQHDGEVSTGLDGKHVASCSPDCGWVGKPKVTEQAAWDELHEHIVYAQSTED